MKVALVKCNQYEIEQVKTSIRKSLELINAWDQIKKDAKVFIKLNCLGAFPEDLAITTHPVFVQAVIQLVKEKTNNIIVGDNPATKDLIFSLKKCGVYKVIKEEKVEIVDGKTSITINNDDYKLFRSFEVSKEMIEVDVMINLPKLKTHALTYMTCAQKNLFGLIYGFSKAGWHVRASNPLEFGEAINDLYGAIINAYQDKTLIHICDGILGLEGEGPSTSGLPKKANLILASCDAISLDRVAVEVVGLNYEQLFMNKIAHKRGFGQGDLKEIEILGSSLDDFKDLSFIAPKDALSIRALRLLKIKTLRNIILEHPVIDIKKCIRCGECVKICPPKALQMKKYPKLSTTKCIRCWCCSEVCPKNAITKSKRPLLGRIFLKDRD